MEPCTTRWTRSSRPGAASVPTSTSPRCRCCRGSAGWPRVLDERRADAFVEHGLQAHEFDVLAALRRSGEPFELTAGELCALTHVTSGTMTSRLDRLTARKFVSRHPDPRDGRLVRVRLTATGRRRVDAAFAALLDTEHDLLAALPRRQAGRPGRRAARRCCSPPTGAPAAG